MDFTSLGTLFGPMGMQAGAGLDSLFGGGSSSPPADPYANQNPTNWGPGIGFNNGVNYNDPNWNQSGGQRWQPGGRVTGIDAQGNPIYEHPQQAYAPLPQLTAGMNGWDNPANARTPQGFTGAESFKAPVPQQPQFRPPHLSDPTPRPAQIGQWGGGMNGAQGATYGYGTGGAGDGSIYGRQWDVSKNNGQTWQRGNQAAAPAFGINNSEWKAVPGGNNGWTPRGGA